MTGRLWQTWQQLKGIAGASPAEAAADLINDYRKVFGTEAGGRVLTDILRRAGLMQTSFKGDGAEAAAFREGSRRVALEIIETINRDPAAIRAAAISGSTEDLYHAE